MDVASKSLAKRLLYEADKIPLKRLGQHYLIEKNLIERFIHFLKIPLGVTVVEIGPGLAFITQRLLSKNYRVVGIEVDKHSVEILRRKWALHWHKGLRAFANKEGTFMLYQEDIRDVNFKILLRHLGIGKMFLIGALPYYISSAVLFKAMACSSLLRGMGFVLQKEVAERLMASVGSKDYSLLSVLSSYYFTMQKGFVMGKSAFYPSPKVQSMAIRFEKRQRDIDVTSEDLFHRVVKAAFNQRRKYFYKALQNASISSLPKKPLLQALNMSQDLRTQRAPDLTWEAYVRFVNLYDSLIKKTNPSV